MSTYDPKQDYIGIAVVTVLFLLVCVAWNAYYIQPRNDMINATLDCLDDLGLDLNEPNWEQCWDIAVNDQEEGA